jgi:membrane-bound lytic murein transglycosylase D
MSRLLFLILFLGMSAVLAGRQDSIFPQTPAIQDTVPGAYPAAFASEPITDTYDSITDPFRPEGELVLRNGENLDSLLNLWFVRENLDNADFDYDPKGDTLIPVFPDSVYISRLAEIPSVVDLTYNRIVRNYIHVYTRKRREQVRTMLGLAEYYFPHYEAIFDLYGVPYEIKYLSVVESALNPRAVSRAGAVGTWQFMYSTGRHYGLTINSLVDERRDPVASTHAAAKFLRDLYNMYKDWTLALAAYNCGPGNVNKAIRRSGGKRSFWEIYYYLPRETRGYVPAFIAATYSMHYYPEHLIRPADTSLVMPTDTIHIHEQVHMKQVAGVMSLPVQLLRDLNPQYRADVIPGSRKRPYPLRLPQEFTGSFLDLSDSIFAFKDSVYFPQGDRVASPQRSSGSYQVDLPADKYDKLYYTVRSGDNVGYVADWYDVRASDLRYWNNIHHNLIRTGQKLVIYKPKGHSERYRALNSMSFAEKQAFAGRQ